MSEQTYVNRVDQTQFLKAEGEKLQETLEADLDHMNLEGPQTARITHIDEAVEAPDDNIGNVASASTIGAANVLLGGISLDDEFKKQVIAAFRHLGLDVRKHFGV